MRAGLRLTSILVCALMLLVGLAATSAQAQPVGRVYLMRGLANVFSFGLDHLAEALQARRVNAQVFGYEQWERLADDAVAWSRANGRAPVVIVGHSLGADAAISMAERMTALGIPPALVVTFDPVGVTTIGAARGRFVNFYQDNNGFGKRLTATPQFRGKLVNRNLTGAPGIDHFNIEKNLGLHAQVVNDILAVMSAPRPKPRPREIRPEEPVSLSDMPPAPAPAPVSLPSASRPDVMSGPLPDTPAAAPAPSAN